MNFPSTKQLQYFVALVDAGHFGRAASACFVSQSAFSNAIQALESTLDAQLVDRTNRRVTITAVGQEVNTLARLVLRDLTDLVEAAAGGPASGEVISRPRSRSPSIKRSASTMLCSKMRSTPISARNSIERAKPIAQPYAIVLHSKRRADRA
jgi:hypothetical protein